MSVPVEGCARLPGLPGVRKVGPDSLTRRCSDQGCNFGARAGLKCRGTGTVSMASEMTLIAGVLGDTPRQLPFPTTATGKCSNPGVSGP